MRKSRQSTGHYNGLISGYAVDESRQMLVIYITIYGRNMSEQYFFCETGIKQLYVLFADLPIYKKNGEIDLSGLIGIPVHVRVKKINDRIVLRKIKFNLAYYGLGR